MRAAVLAEYGIPKIAEFDDPIEGDGGLVVDVLASAISRFDVLLAAGLHPSIRPVLPSVAGREGIGRLSDDRCIYFDAPVPPYGSMAERTLISSEGFIEVPPGVDPAIAAALGNGGLAGLLPLQWRGDLSKGDVVLILGAAGIVGRFAVQLAKVLGAGRVVAADINETGLEKAKELGADACVLISPDSDVESLTAAYRAAAGGGANVIVDYVAGVAAEAAMGATAHGARFVQVGSAAGSKLAFPVVALRHNHVDLRGYTNYNVPLDVRGKAFRELNELASQGRLTVEISRVSLDETPAAWQRTQAGVSARQVVIP